MNQGNAQKPKILYVEDDPRSRLIVKKLLESTGCEVYEASDGETGVEKALDLKPDAVLMDIMLEGPMDGIEAYRALAPGGEIPIIYLTANTDLHVRERAMGTNPVAIVSKPIDKQHLLELIAGTIGPGA